MLLKMKCLTVSEWLLILGPACIVWGFIPKLNTLLHLVLNFQSCVWWCSGGLLELINRKIIPPGWCDIGTRWLITKCPEQAKPVLGMGSGRFLHTHVVIRMNAAMSWHGPPNRVLWSTGLLVWLNYNSHTQTNQACYGFGLHLMSAPVMSFS